MTTQPAAPAPAPTTPPGSNTGIEAFVQSPLGKIIVAILTPITRMTVMKSKDAQGKVVEKTPLDGLQGTVIGGVVLTLVLVVAIRVWLMVYHNMR